MENTHSPQDHLESAGIDVGESRLSWQTWEYPPHERSRSWFIVASVVGAGLLVYAIATGNFMFAIIILMMGIILLISTLRHPNRVHVHITDLGIVFGDQFFDFEGMKDFSIIYNPPEVKMLYVDFQRLWQPLLTIDLHDIDPNAVREQLLPYVFENLEREEETLTDMVRRMYKL